MNKRYLVKLGKDEREDARERERFAKENSLDLDFTSPPICLKEMDVARALRRAFSDLCSGASPAARLQAQGIEVSDEGAWQPNWCPIGR